MSDDGCFGNREEMIARYKALKTEIERLRSSVEALVEALRKLIVLCEREEVTYDDLDAARTALSQAQENAK